MSDDCLFCKIVSGQIKGRKVYETKEVSAFHDVNPQAPTHILIVPKKHIERVYEIDGEEDVLLMGRLVEAARDIVKQESLDVDGFRLVMNNGPTAGQTVFHVHLHLLSGRKMNWPPG